MEGRRARAGCGGEGSVGAVVGRLWGVKWLRWRTAGRKKTKSYGGVFLCFPLVFSFKIALCVCVCVLETLFRGKILFLLKHHLIFILINFYFFIF